MKSSISISHPRPSAPKGLPLCLRVAPDDRFAATGPTLRQKVLSLCPVPADFASLRLPGLGLFHGWLHVDSKGRAGPETRHDLCNNHLPPTRPRFRLAGIARSAPPCGRRSACVFPLARSLSLRSLTLAHQFTPLHLTTLLLDGPLRRPLRRYTAHAGGSATPVATAPSLPIARITLSP